MELEEMKTLWEDMSQKVDQQKILTDQLIIDMTQERYTNKLRSISVPETIGAIICFIMAAYVMVNFYKLDIWYLQLSGILSVAFCIVLPILSLRSIQKMKKINIAKNTFKQSLIDYAKGKKQFMFIQKLSLYLSFLFMIVCLPVAGKLIGDKDIFIESKVWFWYLPIMIVFLVFFSRWGYKCYANITTSAENMLKELEN